MDTEKIEIHTDPLNHRLIEKLDGMRPKVDPMPAAKARALVIGAAAAGLSLVIATGALAWSSFEDSKRKDVAQAAKIEADKVRAEHEATVSLLKVQVEADAIKSGSEPQSRSTTGDEQAAILPNLSNLPVDQPSTASAGGKDQTDIRTTVTVFKERPFAGGAVLTGWNFPSSSSPSPNSQFCYFTRATGKATSDRLELATENGPKEFSTTDRAKVGLSEQQVRQARTHCQWFVGSRQEIDSSMMRQSSALPTCSEVVIQREEEHLSKPMRFCDAGNGRVIAIGELVAGTYKELRKALDHVTSKTIVLDSPGGLVSEARQMAELIRERQLNTHALSQCNSACITVMSAGVMRTADDNATFGLHQPAWDKAETLTREDIASYWTSSRSMYIAHGVDPRLEELEWANPNTDLKSISVSEARTFKLVNG